MSRRMKSDSGFTLVEVMVATSIFLFAVTIAFNVMLTTLKMDRNTQTEAILHQQGSKVIDRIIFGERGLYGIMKASQASITIPLSQDSITFSVDTNASFTSSSADDVTMSFSFVDGDSDPTTYQDNTIVFDPNTAVANNEITIATNVSDIEFSEAGGVVSVVLTMAETVKGETELLRLSRDIWVRNP